MKKDTTNTTMDSKINLLLTRSEAILLGAALLSYSYKISKARTEEGCMLFERIIKSINDYDKKA